MSLSIGKKQQGVNKMRWFKESQEQVDLGRGRGGPGRGGFPKTDEERAKTHGVDIKDLPPRGTGRRRYITDDTDLGRGRGGPGRGMGRGRGPGRGRRTYRSMFIDRSLIA